MSVTQVFVMYCSQAIISKQKYPYQENNAKKA